jgi:GntR family transcriptional regulator/MocR family aminotransferase
VPLYRQIKEYLRQGIVSGSLAPHTRLPASRQLAHDLGLNRITVESAYAELEADGQVQARMGSGTYVVPGVALSPLSGPEGDVTWPLWQQRLTVGGEAAAAQGVAGNGSAHPHEISLASGKSDAHLFPADDFRRVIQTVMRRDGVAALDYGEHNGYTPLRETLSHILATQGLHARPESILMTAGSQQALSLVARRLLNPGDMIVVESPTYSGALDLFRALGLEIAGVPMDGQGMVAEDLEHTLQRHHPKLIYTIPNFHNPTGVCMSATRRRQLLVLADRYNVPVLEDDYVGDLRYHGRAQPSLKALDPGGRVIYVSTFSKMLMPGLRVGFLVADGPVYDCLASFKRVNDIATSSLVQRALEAYVTVGRYQAHLRRSCQIHHRRLDATLAAIEQHLPGVHVEPPQGGLFVWAQLPDGLSADELLPLARQAGTDFAPGSRFFPDPAEGRGWMRLNCVCQPAEEIEEAIVRLAKAVRRLAGGS